MFSRFTYEAIALQQIQLDSRNPRIVTQAPLKSQEEILQYLFEYESLSEFIKKIATEGKNLGAERPYVVKERSNYTVIEGNTRIAAYKVLTGQLKPPRAYASGLPKISAALKKNLLSVDCSIAPTRDALLPIMASAHFGLGDKSKWGYLGSRKAVYDEWVAGKKIPQLAAAFDRTKGQIQELILEYKLYLEALKLPWTPAERAVLLDPKVEFNPPVRFLQTSGHKAKVGLAYDTVNMTITFAAPDTKKKFKHLIEKLVIRPSKGLGATASYEDVFSDFEQKGTGASAAKASSTAATQKAGSAKAAASSAGTSTAATASQPSSSKLKSGSLFYYPVTVRNALIDNLMKEAASLNCNKFPAAATFLLRNLVETLLKEIIHLQKANPASKTLDLAACLTSAFLHL